MEFRVLGPVEFLVEGVAVPTGHPRQRSVLAVLLAEANRPVLTEHLVDRVWGERAPTNVRNVLSGYITRLRIALTSAAGDEVGLSRRSGGYVLTVDDDRVDLLRFHRLAAQARTADDIEARMLLAEALSLWRGPAFADLTSPWLVNLRETLEQERMTVLLRYNDLALQQGQHADLLAGLRELAVDHPLDERVIRQLMLALYRSGRVADALAVFTEARGRLADELGLDPGPELRELEQRILSSDPVLEPETPPVAAGRDAVRPQQLPPGTADFSGREAELAELDRIAAGATPRAAGAGAVLLSAIDGTAGVGKTALAVYWARRAMARFPDGQLFVNLRGHTPGPPLEPVAALTQFLRALGVPPERVPLEEDEAAALYRTLLADRRVLVLLDDAARPEQVRPLLPGSPNSLVLITSRNRLSGLIAKDGASRVTVDLLSDTAARGLLARIVGERRVEAEPNAVAELVRLCARLPLALRIAAANLANRSEQPIAEYVRELARGNRLDALEVEGDRESAVRIAFNLSYAALPADARQLFRRLGLVPGSDFTAETAAALLGVPAAEAAGLLKTLAAAHLVEVDDRRRYHCHDLLRLYARDRADREESAPVRTATVNRLADFYLTWVDAASMLLAPQMIRIPWPAGMRERDRTELPRPGFADHQAALTWLDAERANILALIEHVVDDPPSPVAWLLADGLRGYFWLRRCAAEWLAASRTALRAAELAGDVLAQAATRLSIGDLHWTVMGTRQATENYRSAFELARRVDWPIGQAAILGNLASTHVELGELDRAEDNYLAALDLWRTMGNPHGQAITLSNLGNLYWEIGSLHRAADHFAKALAMHEPGEALVAKANALLNLGSVHHEQGCLATALDTLLAALAVCRQIGDASDEATALDALARVHRDAGRLAEAMAHADLALERARQLEARRMEASALNTIGSVFTAEGRPGEAVARHEQALTLAQATGDQRGETEARLGLASAALAARLPTDALDHLERALERSRAAGYRLLTARAHTLSGAAYLMLDEPELAQDRVGPALDVQLATGDKLWAAHSRHVLGCAELARGNVREARHSFELALAGFVRVGAPGTETRRELDRLGPA